jgi:TonB family protein
MLERCFSTALRMTPGTTMNRWIRWPLLLAGPLLCLPAALLQSAPLRVAQVSGELLVPARSVPQPAGRDADDCAGQPPSDCPASAGGDPSVPEPRPLELVSPAYPSRAQRLEQDGRVVVCFTVDESGAVREPVVVSSSDTLFNDPVLQAIAASRFLPAESDGQPVKSTACRTYRFVAR